MADEGRKADGGGATPPSRRPRVVCHMVGSVDGRIVVDGWQLSPEGRAEYERIHDQYGAEGWLCGRVTMEAFAGGVRAEEEVAREDGAGPREDFVAPGDHGAYAFAVDPSGRLAWESSEIEGDHVVAILTQRVTDDYLAFLRGRGVSYVFAGHRELDLCVALGKIAELFRVRTLMLEGGGRINGSMLKAGLVDELSLLLAPVGDGRVGTASLFDADGEDREPDRLVLEAVERCAADVVWLRYRIQGETEPSGD